MNKTYYAIHWIVIYPVDSIIHPSNNQGLQGCNRIEAKKLMKKPCALVLVQDIEGKIVRKLPRGTHILGFFKTSGVRNTQCKLHSFGRLTV